MSSAAVSAPPLWRPSADQIADATLTRFTEFVRTEHGVDAADYHQLWQWSVTDLDGFWSAVWQFFGLHTVSGYDRVLAEDTMPHAQWFPGARINFAQAILDAGDCDTVAVVGVVGVDETGATTELTRAQLRRQVGALAVTRAEAGGRAGDVVAGYLPNIPEAVVAFLATASLGAIWSAVGQDYAAGAVIDRFAQLPLNRYSTDEAMLHLIQPVPVVVATLTTARSKPPARSSSSPTIYAFCWMRSPPLSNPAQLRIGSSAARPPLNPDGSLTLGPRATKARPCRPSASHVTSDPGPQRRRRRFVPGCRLLIDRRERVVQSIHDHLGGNTIDDRDQQHPGQRHQTHIHQHRQHDHRRIPRPRERFGARDLAQIRLPVPDQNHTSIATVPTMQIASTTRLTTVFTRGDASRRSRLRTSLEPANPTAYPIAADAAVIRP